MDNGECDANINVYDIIHFEIVNSRDKSNGLDEDQGTCWKLSKKYSHRQDDFSDTLDAI